MKNPLISRWTVSPGKEILRAIFAIFADCNTINHVRSSKEVTDLLEGLPCRAEVKNGCDLRGITAGIVYSLDFSGFDFSYASLTNFYNCRFANAVFDCARISGGLLQVLDGATFVNAKLKHCFLQGASARACIFDGASLGHAKCSKTDFEGSSFRKSDCSGAVFIESSLIGCDFREANLDGAIICGASLDQTTDFRGASLMKTHYKDWNDNKGNVIHSGVDWRLAKWDETTQCS